MPIMIQRHVPATKHVETPQIQYIDKFVAVLIVIQRVVLHSRLLRSSAQAFPGEEQRVGHRARFPRPGHAQRQEEELQQKGRRLALSAPLGGAGGWQPGGEEEGTDATAHVTTVCSHDCLNFLARPWPLGPRLGFSVARSSGTHLAQCSYLWGLGSPGHRSHAFHHDPHAASGQGLAESMPGLGRRWACLHQGWRRRRRGRQAGRVGAACQANGDMFATMVGWAQGECQAACRPGGLGRAVATTFTRRG